MACDVCTYSGYGVRGGPLRCILTVRSLLVLRTVHICILHGYVIFRVNYMSIFR